MSQFTSVALIALAALVASPLPVTRAGDMDADNNLIAICSDKPVDLYAISQVRNMLRSFDWGVAPEWCPGVTRLALEDLRPIIDSIQADSCGAELVDRVVAFKRKYLSGDVNYLIPVSLGNFFLGLGLNVAETCKLQLLDHLYFNFKKMQELGGEEFKKIFGPEGERLKHYVGCQSYNDLIEFAQIKRQAFEVFKERGVAQISFRGASKLGGLQSMCRRLVPTYKSALDAVVSLSSVGFNFKAINNIELRSKNPDYITKYKIVYICENVLSVKLFDRPEDDNYGVIEASTDSEAHVKGVPVDSGNTQVADDQAPTGLYSTKYSMRDVVIGWTINGEHETDNIDKLSGRDRKNEWFKSFVEGIQSYFHNLKVRMLSSMIGPKREIYLGDVKLATKHSDSSDSYCTLNECTDEIGRKAAILSDKSVAAFGDRLYPDPDRRLFKWRNFLLDMLVITASTSLFFIAFTSIMAFPVLVMGGK